MTPKIRIAPSCASSPGKFDGGWTPRGGPKVRLSIDNSFKGGTPGGGLPVRRHSSIGPQERRGSAMNLSPPAVSIRIYFFNEFFN